MKLLELLQEKTLIKNTWIVNNTGLKKTIDLLNKHCKDSIGDVAKGRILFRGMSNIGDTAVIDSSKSYRTSKDSNNIYQLMMDSSIFMKNIPSRSNSLICTTSADAARTYGSPYAIFPFDGTYIACSDEIDFFDAQAVDGSDINSISGMIAEILLALGIKPDESTKFINAGRLDSELSKFPSALLFFMLSYALVLLPNDNVDSILEKYNKLISDNSKNPIITSSYPPTVASLYGKSKIDINLLSKVIDNIEKLPIGKTIWKKIKNNNKNVFTTVSSALMNPDVLDIKLTIPGKIKEVAKHDKECWFSGKCVAIHLDIFTEIILEMKKQRMPIGKSILDEFKHELLEKINEKLFWQGYEESKSILDGKYTLHAKAGYVKLGAKSAFKSEQFRIEVKTKKGTMVGWVNFENKDGMLEALDLWIDSLHRRKGIATEMYKFARELGNDIRPSDKQTGMGKQFWTKINHSTGERHDSDFI